LTRILAALTIVFGIQMWSGLPKKDGLSNAAEAAILENHKKTEKVVAPSRALPKVSAAFESERETLQVFWGEHRPSVAYRLREAELFPGYGLGEKRDCQEVVSYPVV